MKLLDVSHLSVTYPKQDERALDNVSFSLQQGQALGIVGESGCGKSTLVRSILQLQTYQAGNILWKGQPLDPLNKVQRKQFYRQAQPIFQDPLDALNPRFTIAQILAEPLWYLSSKKPSRLEVKQAIDRVLDCVGLSSKILNRYPHEFSGGQCQRIGIARAIIVQPELLICDEPVSALDVSVQAQIMNVLLDLKEHNDLSLIFVSHDLSVVRHISDQVLVMQQGCVVEIGATADIYSQPKAPYTQALLDAILY